jgi:glycosyltransferase involved in cell wall biosynthesis
MDFLRSEASLLVHPSRLESFGMAIVEAKARGVPVVAGASSGATRYVCDDPVSALVDIEDPLAIATAVLKLLSGQASYDCARRISSDDVKRRFSSETVASMYEAAYERAASAQ